MRCVTSFSEQGYKQYGRKFLDTYVESVGLPIDVYVETNEILRSQQAFAAAMSGTSTPEDKRILAFGDYKQHELVKYHHLFKVEGCSEFLSMCQFPAAQGRLWGEKRNYRFDTFKFARKSFAQIDAASRAPDKLVWLDADIEFNGEFVFPTFGDEFMQYLGRPEWHSCASFVAWNTAHPVAGEFFKRYWLLHVTGTIFCLPEWHDSFVLDWLREQSDVPARNLAAPYKDQLKGPANVFDVVFPPHHHKKGKLKQNESSGPV